MAAGGLDLARRLHEELFELNRAVFWDTKPIPIKYLMKAAGLLASDEHRLPMRGPEPARAARLDSLLERTRVVGAAAGQPPTRA